MVCYRFISNCVIDNRMDPAVIVIGNDSSSKGRVALGIEAFVGALKTCC